MLEPVSGSRLQSSPDDAPDDAPLCPATSVIPGTEVLAVDGPLESFADESLQSLSPAVEQLLSKYEAPPLPAMGRAHAAWPTESPTGNNAQRTSAQSLEGLHTALGITSDGQSFYAEAAAVKGSRVGAGVELLSGSVQVGAQNEAQLGLERVTLAAPHGSVEVRTLTAEVHGGVHNPDGSVGYNAGFSLNAIGMELNAGASGNSLTVGISIGPGVEGSMGTRDADGDGKTEACFRAAAGIATIGACVEPTLVVDVMRETYDNATAAVAGWVRL
jgi:hypothetical protein